jgi:hypothetical protein
MTDASTLLFAPDRQTLNLANAFVQDVITRSVMLDARHRF